MKALTACLTFGFTTVLAAIALAFPAGGLGPGVTGLALTLGTLGAGWAWHTTRDPSKPAMGAWDFIVLTGFALASLRAFLWLIYSRGDEIYVLSPNNLGDMSLHLNFVRYLSSGIPFWPESSILTGVPLTYPLGSDLFNSLLEICGVETGRGLIVVALISAGLTGYALWRWAGAFGVAAFLFSGGLAGFAIFKTFTFEDFQAGLVWKNLFLSMFVTQRGLLFALPAGLLLLIAWRDRFFRTGGAPVSPGIQLLLYAGMPIFSLHTFLFLSLILLALFVAKASFRRELLRFVGAAFLPATVAILLVTGGFSTSAGLRWLPRGLLTDGEVWDWIWNFGLILPAGLALAISLWRHPDPEARCLAGTSLGLFVVACFVAFAPWEWDNMKLLMWCWLVVAPTLWTKLILPLPAQARAAVCVLLFFSGAVSLVGGLDGRHGYSIAKHSELDAWKVSVNGISTEDRFACAPDYNHPLILLGRKVACGYEGHLWSHGLDFRPKLNLLKEALADPALWPSAAPALEVQWLALRAQDIPPAQAPEDLLEGGAALYDLSVLEPGRPEPTRLPVRVVSPLP